MQDSILEATSKMRGRPRKLAEQSENVTVQALDRALEALAILAQSDGLTLSDLAQRMGLSAATVYRALVTMQSHEIVEVTEPGQIWHVGVGTFRLGAAFARRSGFVERAKSAMAHLQRISDETAILAQHNAGEVLVLAQATPEVGIRASFPPGTRGALHATAAGKVLLAYLPEDHVRKIMAQQGMAKATSLTITSVSSLLRDLARVRERGYALDDQESAEGVRAIAAPIFGPDSAVQAALAVVGPAFRFGLSAVNAMAAPLRDAAKDLTKATGGTANWEE